MSLSADDYIKLAAQARACYAALFEAATLALPINVAGQHNIECHFSARDLVAKLPGRSVSVVRNEIKWLIVNGWVIERTSRSVKFLGRRLDGVMHLLADVAAKQATGEDRLVSRSILNITLPGAPATPESTKRGTGRRWTGDAGAVSGGALDLGT